MTVTPRPPVTDLLPPAASELFTISDTHLVDTSSPHATEFASRLLQNDRIDAVLSVVAGHGVDVVHLGDLVQDYPASAEHAGLLRNAVAQLRATGVQTVYAPGNTDIGDPHDPASPADAVTEPWVDGFAAAVGYPWTAADVAGLRVILLAGSVLNSGLAYEERQWSWLQRELEAAAGRRIVLGLHYPLFLRSQDDPDIGHYDVVNEPARSRLIGLIERYGVELVLTGHSHWQFLNRIGDARAYVLPSTSFTRPGFSEMFSSAAPPDRGRNDVPKLGCMLARVHPGDIRMHRVRTAGLVDRPATSRPVLSCVPKDLPGSRLGVTLHHPFATFAEVPDTFPSVIRQPVRNDYPLLSCLELGAGRISVTAADLADPDIAARLQVLRDEGVAVVVRLLWAAGSTPIRPAADAPIDEVELVLLNRDRLQPEEARAVADWPWPLLVSALTKLPKGSAELPRWCYGLPADSAAAVDGVLAEAGRSGDRVLVAGGAPRPAASWRSIAGIDQVLAAPGVEAASLASFAGDLLGALADRSARVWIDGLTELDRTLVTATGLLDRACNPRPGFHVARLLASALQSDPDAVIEPSAGGRRASVSGGRFRALVDATGAVPGEGVLIDLALGETAAAVPAGSPAMLLAPTASAADVAEWLAADA